MTDLRTPILAEAAPAPASIVRAYYYGTARAGPA
jgi:hypothetical protein